MRHTCCGAIGRTIRQRELIVYLCLGKDMENRKKNKDLLYLLIALLIISTFLFVRFYLYRLDTRKLIKAIENEDIVTVEKLLNDGVDPNKPTSEPNVLDSLFEHSPSLPLSVACDVGNYEIIKMLIDYGATAEHIEGTGWSPLMESLFYYKKDTVKIVKLLLDNGADPYLKEYDYPVFHAASMVPQVYDANKTNGTVFITGYDEETAKGITEIVIMLLGDESVDITTTGSKRTLLMFAAKENNIYLAEYLLSRGCDPTKENSKGMTALDIAIINDSDEVAELLMNHRT